MSYFSRLAFFGLALVLSPLVLGCESHEICGELCERSGSCEGAEGEDACVSSCESDQESAEGAGCGGEWESYIECFAHATDVCDVAGAQEECSVQYDAYQSCGGAE